MKPIICFIDDSDFEHDLVRKDIAPRAPDLAFFQAYTFDEATDKLGGKIPALFLLDLWGDDPAVEKPFLTPKEEVLKRVSGFKSLDEVYEGLADFRPEQTNEFLKRFFSIVDSWRHLFEDVCDRLGQNRKYGLANIRDVKRYYPGVPAVFYTRKSLINDAVAMFEAGSDGLFIKPTGRNDRETRELTRKRAPELIESWSCVIDRHLSHLIDHKTHYMSESRHRGVDIDHIIDVWQQFRNYLKTPFTPP
ncbi:MAG: hypothetical protein JRJ85_14395 [Deltaproteobacteria bacterium]|nr:hypothetical protein [Deltaproteobacteria bacterium]